MLKILNMKTGKQKIVWLISTLILTLALLTWCNRAAFGQDNLKRIIGIETQIAQPCDTITKIVFDCPPKKPISHKPPKLIDLTVKPILLASNTTKDTNDINVMEFKTGVKVYNYNNIYMPAKRMVISFTKGSLYKWSGVGCYATGATCLIIGASRHIEHTCITVHNVVIYDNDNIRQQERIQRNWVIAGSSLVISGFILNYLGYHWDKKHSFTLKTTSNSVGFTKTF